jgi:hypothetical protein
MIETYKIMSGKYDRDVAIAPNLVLNRKTRGNNYKTDSQDEIWS